MPIFTNRHGVIRPGIPQSRIINTGSRKQGLNPICLEKLFKLERPVICIKRRLGGIGDVIMTTPALQALKKLIPHCKLIYATDLKYSDGALGDVIRHNPYVDELIGLDQIKESEYDYSVDITATGLNKERSMQLPPNRIDMFAEAIGISVDDYPFPTYEVTEEERAIAKNEIQKLLKDRDKDKTKIIVIQARSNDVRRTWPAQSVQELADLLSNKEDYLVLLYDWGHSVGTWKDKKNLVLMLDKKFVETAAIVEQADLVVCPDSSMLHIAGALNKKTVSIFGPIPPQSRINHYTNAIAVIHKVSCQFCWYSPKCHKDNNHAYLECLTGIKPQQVYDAVLSKIEAPYMTDKIVCSGKTYSIANQDPIIMVRRNSTGIGDLLMATTGIEALKSKYPTKKIHVAVPKSIMSILENNPLIDEVIDITTNINHKRYFLIADITSPCARYETTRIRSNKLVEKNRVEIYAEALGVRELITTLKPKYYISDKEKEKAKEFFSAKQISQDKKTIAVVVESAEIYRSWPMTHIVELISILKNTYNIIAVSKNKLEIEGIVQTGNSTFREMSAIVSLCDLVVTPDTGVLHLAAALNIPTIALFGPIDYRARCKGYKNVTVIKTNISCSPCWRNGETKCKQTGIIQGYSKCLENILPKQVLEVINQKI
jgi:ADP-heptose:LPS heptosyltransferase